MELRRALGTTWRLAVAFVASLLVSLIVFLLILGGPLWVLMAIYGRESMMDSPAHGRVIVFLTGPVAFCAACATWLIMGKYIFERRSTSN